MNRYKNQIHPIDIRRGTNGKVKHAAKHGWESNGLVRSMEAAGFFVQPLYAQKYVKLSLLINDDINKGDSQCH
ncbi:hypothetical protein GCM10027286_29400 [Virgibacillus ainsalahensis]